MMSPVRKLLEDLKRLRLVGGGLAMDSSDMIETLANAILDLDARIRDLDRAHTRGRAMTDDKAAAMNGEPVIGYMCRIDFECELGGACGGNTIYPDIEDLREHRKCVDSCGIVEVEVRCRRIVEPGKW